MDGDQDSDSAGQAAPGAADTAETSSPILAPDERKLRFKRYVFDQTREARARVRRQKDFEAVISRGSRVNHRLHMIIVFVLLGLALAFGRAGTPLLFAGLAVAGAYGFFWYFLTATGGEEIEHLSIDELGRITSVKSGRDVERRADVLRVAIPAIVIVVSGWISVGLVHDIVFSPAPRCDATAEDPPGACLRIPNLFALARATADISHAPTATPARTASPSASASAAASPVASPSASAAPAAKNGTFTLEETKTLERFIRGMQLVVSLTFLLASIWFVRRMLTGRWVGFIRPVHHKLSDG